MANLKTLTLIVGRHLLVQVRSFDFFWRGCGIARVLLTASNQRSSPTGAITPLREFQELARQGLQPGDAALAAFKDSNRGKASSVITEASKSFGVSHGVRKTRVRVASENRLWLESLMRMLAGHAGLEMLGGDWTKYFALKRFLKIRRMCYC